MKLTDLRRKLGAAFAAGGLLAPGITHAANLNTNLVLNPGFENVDINTWVPVAGVDPLAFAVKILDWGGTEMGFAYSHAGLTTGEGGAIGDFANGGPLPSGGNFYFTPNATMMPTPGITSPSQFFQEIDVSTGASGNLIASGIANYKVGAFFSSHLTDGDFGSVHVDFLDSANNSLATAVVSDNDVTTWSQNFGGGPIPIGTAKVRLSVFGTALTAGPDGYVDNVDFQVTNEMLQPALQINVNRDTGAISLVNQTGGPASFKSYSITSEYGSLEPASWLSIAENYDAGSPGANQVDPAHDWSKLTDESTHGDLSEADLQVAVGATISHTRTINLGNAWLQAPTEDLVFQYISGDQVVQGIVNYTGHSGSAFANGDFNFDSAINSADWMIFRANQHGDFTGKSGAEAYQMGDISGDSQNNHTDFVIFKTLYDAANGAGAFVAMLAAVPEPSAAVLVLTAGLFTLPLRRRVRDGGLDRNAFRTVGGFTTSLPRPPTRVRGRGEGSQNEFRPNHLRSIRRARSTSMKVTNWRRKLMASLAAGGMLSPLITCAANLDTNLVANPGFESVNDTGTLGEYNTPLINGWIPAAPDKQGFAYSHNGSLSNGNVVPNFANGDPLASGGNWYFTPNAEPNDAVINGPGQFFQDIEVSTSPSGGLIAEGTAAYKIGAFFNNFETQGDFGHLHLDFRNSAGTSIGMAEVVGVPPFEQWEQNVRGGLIPVGTQTVRVSIYGTTPVGGGPDGYMDNVDFQITNAAKELLFLQVDTTTGQVSMRNMTGDPVAIDYYEITSASNALDATAWNSLQEQNAAGFPAGNGSGNGWEQFGGSDAGVIGESYLAGNSSLANVTSIDLGNAFIVGGTPDLKFKYAAITSSAQIPGDYNVNGVVDAPDYVVWRDKLGQNVTLPNDSTPGTVTPADYELWRANFGKSGPPAGPGTLTTGFIRYVTSELAASAAVPERSTLLLVGIGLGPIVLAGRRKATDDGRQ